MRDAPWIEETERTGHYWGGWWNTPDEDEDECDEWDD